MRLVRTATALALAGSLFAVGGSQAATAPACNLITDPKGDADLEGGQGNDSALDITSVDFGADAKTMTVVIRIDKASTKSAVFPVGAIKLSTFFSINGTGYFTSILSDNGAVSGNFGTTGTGSNTILTFPAGVIDVVKNEARISIPAADFPTGYKVGDVVSAIRASTSSGVVPIATPVVNGSTGGFGVDSATSDATYRTGTKTCVTVGK